MKVLPSFVLISCIVYHSNLQQGILHMPSGKGILHMPSGKGILHMPSGKGILHVPLWQGNIPLVKRCTCVCVQVNKLLLKVINGY